jgi:hypothetical protein
VQTILAPEIFRSPGNKKYFAMPDRGPEIEATSFLSIKIRTRMIRGLAGRSLPCDAIRYRTDICGYGSPLSCPPAKTMAERKNWKENRYLKSDLSGRLRPHAEEEKERLLLADIWRSRHSDRSDCCREPLQLLPGGWKG